MNGTVGFFSVGVGITVISYFVPACRSDQSCAIARPCSGEPHRREPTRPRPYPRRRTMAQRAIRRYLNWFDPDWAHCSAPMLTGSHLRCRGRLSNLLIWLTIMCMWLMCVALATPNAPGFPCSRLHSNPAALAPQLRVCGIAPLSRWVITYMMQLNPLVAPIPIAE
jgi:hypothetical protein